MTAFLPLVLWMGLIFFFSEQEKIPVTGNYTVSFIIFKSLHLIEYGILYLLWARFLHLSGVRNFYLLAFILTFLYGVSDELHQTVTPTREGTLRDVLIDGLGAFVANFFLTRVTWLSKIVLHK